MKHIVIGVMCTNLVIVWGCHILGFHPVLLFQSTISLVASLSFDSMAFQVLCHTLRQAKYVGTFFQVIYHGNIDGFIMGIIYIYIYGYGVLSGP